MKALLYSALVGGLLLSGIAFIGQSVTYGFELVTFGWLVRPFIFGGVIGSIIGYLLARRRQLLTTLSESEQRFRDFAEVGADRLWETDADYRITFISDSNASNEEAHSAKIGLTGWEMPGVDPEEELWGEFRADLDARRPLRDFRYTLTEPDGQKRHLRVSGKPVFDENGDFKGYRGVTVDDGVQAKLKETYYLLELLFEYLPTSIVILDRDFNFIRVNESYARECGHDVEFFPGKNHFDLFPSDAEQIFLEVREKKQPFFIYARPFEFLDHPEWGITYWDWALVPILDGDGEVEVYVWSIKNVTEQQRLQEQLRQSQKMEALGLLTGGIAHDFNNLLYIMSGNMELMEDEISVDKSLLHRFEKIKGAIDRASSLTERLLAFSRQQVLLPESTDISGLLAGLEDMLSRTLGETFDLKIENASGLFPAVIDPHQLENTLVNLVVNARDAMPKGGILTIETANVTLDETYEEVIPGDYVMVAVSDTGAGMTTEVLKRVFEPFFTTKGVGKGTGLGLSMVFGFVKQSKGHIMISSEIDHGTTIKLYLPRSQSVVDQAGDKDDTLELERGSERILLVEDSLEVREIPVSILRGQGYEVVEASDGKEAIKHLKEEHSFDLLFTDVVLPGGMSGVEMAKKAKRIQPDIKVLYTTGYAENAIVHNGQLIPGVNLINKPYRRSVFLEKVRAMLDSDID